MTWEKRCWIPIGVFVVVLLIPWPGIFGALRVTHEAKGREMLFLPFMLRHPFDLSFTNSIYLAPTVEKFQVTGSEIRLDEIQTRSWGVVEYYGLPGVLKEENGELSLQKIGFHQPRLRLMIGFIGKQKLVWNGKTYPLYEWSEAGDVLILDLVSLSPVEYLYKKLRRR